MKKNDENAPFFVVFSSVRPKKWCKTAGNGRLSALKLREDHGGQGQGIGVQLIEDAAVLLPGRFDPPKGAISQPPTPKFDSLGSAKWLRNPCFHERNPKELCKNHQKT